MIKKSLLLSILVASFSATAMVPNESSDTTPANDTSRNDDRSCDRPDADGYTYDSEGFIVDRVEPERAIIVSEWPSHYGNDVGYVSSNIYDTHNCTGPTPNEQAEAYRQEWLDAINTPDEECDND